MHDDTEHGNESSGIAVLAPVRVPGLECWAVRLTVALRDGPVRGWAPHVFWSASAAEAWVRGRVPGRVRPTVQSCAHSADGLAYAAVLDPAGAELLVSEPLPRATAGAVAALLAAELRSARG